MGRRTSGRVSRGSAFVLFAATIGAFGTAMQPGRALAEGGKGKTLWKIGAVDRRADEFALAPGRYHSFGKDGVFVIGRSAENRDWPYVHPGPDDKWAEGRSHTFTIVFGVEGKPARDERCNLVIALVDSQSRNPTDLLVSLNGVERRARVVPGGGDGSLGGDLKAARPNTLKTEFPASELQAGANVLGITTVSGSWMIYDGLEFLAPEGLKARPLVGSVLTRLEPAGCLKAIEGKLYQPARQSIYHDGPACRARLEVMGSRPGAEFDLAPGVQEVDTVVPDDPSGAPVQLTLGSGGKTLARGEFRVKPARKLTVYILPHSHTDIGYTEIQTRIEQKQVDNLVQGIADARRTAGYPEGARFVWNVEVLWAADLYLRRLDAAQRADFLDAVRKGQVALNGMYLNELTGLCRTEELLRLFRFATRTAEETGVSIDSAMISDVPGYTWGTVTAMAHAGVRYFSTAPNFFDRIGDILVKWENRPFYWVSPSGREKVLVWIPLKGYAMSHLVHTLTPRFVTDYQAQLDRVDYPYDISYMRWSGHGDNAVPDAAICEFVKGWNAEHAWPKFVISSTSEAFRALEARYGDRLPQVKGDWSPYWEDGAGSSALETGLNRAAADRLTQAEALWAMLDPARYPTRDFEAAWKNVLLYSEHTWGAYCSVTAPSSPLTLEQWQVKQSYAADASRQSRELLIQGLGHRGKPEDFPAGSDEVDVFNTTSWTRTELATLPRGISEAGDRVTDVDGHPVPSQRLASGELAILVRDLAPFSGRRLKLTKGQPHPAEVTASIDGHTLTDGLVRARLDERTGGLAELTARGIEGNLVDSSSGRTINEYLYFLGDDLAGLQGSGAVTIQPGDKGPLVASLVADSEAPGCHHLRREVRVTAGMGAVELINTLDKKRLAARSYMEKDGKESVNFAFPFHIAGGELRLDLPIGAMRPELDQMPGACKNWLTVGRFADVAGRDHGLTWVTLDAPLVQVGSLSARLLNSQTNPDTWRKAIEPSQLLYSWAMNNHWGTNYRAYQEGPTTFRFAIRPHGPADMASASRYAVGLSQPLIATTARGPKPPKAPRLTFSTDDVLATTLKPSDDGKAWIVHLYGASGRDRNVRIRWANPQPSRTWLSDTSERPGRPIEGDILVPGWGIVTVRADRPE